jgi:hypothetical protein
VRDKVADIFISYSKQEREITESLAKYLEGEGYVVWWDAGIATGEKFRSAINAQLEAAKAVIVIWSRNSVVSDWVISEVEQGARRGNLIPLRTSDTDVSIIPMPYSTRHTDLVDNRAAILAALKKLGVEPRYAPMNTGKNLHDHVWERIKDSEHREDFELYLEVFPEGPYVTLARFEIARLKRLEAVVNAAAKSATASAEGEKPRGSVGRRAMLFGFGALAGSALSGAAIWKGAIEPQQEVLRATITAEIARLRQEAEGTEKERILAADDAAWTAAETDGLIGAWRQYLKDWPNGKHVDGANTQIAARLKAGRIIKDQKHNLSALKMLRFSADGKQAFFGDGNSFYAWMLDARQGEREDIEKYPSGWLPWFSDHIQENVDYSITGDGISSSLYSTYPNYVSLSKTVGMEQFGPKKIAARRGSIFAFSNANEIALVDMSLYPTLLVRRPLKANLMAISQSHKVLLAVDSDMQFHVTDIFSTQQDKIIKTRLQNFQFIDISSDGRTAVSANSDEVLRLWDLTAL